MQRQRRLASPWNPHGHGRVAFLPLVKISLKALKPEAIASEPQTLGEHVAKRRKELGLSQREVGKRLGVSAQTVLNWEKGKTEPPVAGIPAILEFLGYDPLPEPETLAEELALKRRRLGCSRSHIAAMLGIDEATWAGWEAGRQVPKGRHAEIIRRFLDRLPV